MSVLHQPAAASRARLATFPKCRPLAPPVIHRRESLVGAKNAPSPMPPRVARASHHAMRTPRIAAPRNTPATLRPCTTEANTYLPASRNRDWDAVLCRGETFRRHAERKSRCGESLMRRNGGSSYGAQTCTGGCPMQEVSSGDTPTRPTRAACHSGAEGIAQRDGSRQRETLCVATRAAGGSCG